MSLYDQQDEEQEATIATNKPLPRWVRVDEKLTAYYSMQYVLS